ncbi:hypothetical protein BU16DRAFT_566919 [Lophium mytilinum]|uniref:Uncharacterized protein n=1 Tax=Lophium mytilinum TaxID=390894 RepID=A0A6A6QCK2_9PEZI|nr:hypothetical protein BU16DRAFT_566919 [Lophium mytilinum]
MRLLDTSTLQLKEFMGDRIPPYAILSHRWGDDEVTFNSIQRHYQSAASLPEGTASQKIRKSCEQAASDGFKYIWIDTCCIDKNSSSELSDAINSMYRYNWFTRGWTLQELIAPSSVVFYDEKWEELGTKATLKEPISQITGIPCDVLLGVQSSESSIAQIMSWAANRQTTRQEDLAYCLLGLFDVHMPMLYGEGKNAFVRLQHEIMKSSNDHSLFAWTGPGLERGPFARSPFESAACGSIRRSPPALFEDYEYTLTNRGLRITLPLLRCSKAEDETRVRAILNCGTEDDSRLAICLAIKSSQPNDLVRVENNEIVSCKDTVLRECAKKEIYISPPNDELFDVNAKTRRLHSTQVVVAYEQIAQNGFSVDQKSGEQSFDSWWDTNEVLYLNGNRACGAQMFKHNASGVRFAIVIGTDNSSVWSDVETDIGKHEVLSDVVRDYLVRDRNVRRYNMVKERHDRVTRHLGDQWAVKLAVKSALKNGQEVFATKITVSTAAPEVTQQATQQARKRGRPPRDRSASITKPATKKPRKIPRQALSSSLQS